MNKWSCLVLVGGLLSLSGCIKLFPEPSEDVQTMKLGGMSIEPATHKKSKNSIAIGEVSGRDHLQSSRIVIEKQDKGLKTLDYIARVEWEDSLPKVVQRDFRNVLSRVIKSVTLENDNLKTDYMVQCDIESFNVEQKEGRFSTVSLGWYLKIVRLPSRSVVASTFLSKTSPLQGKDKQAVFEVFNSAYRSLLQDSETWVLDQIRDTQ